MKRRLLSFVLAFAMLLSVTPVAVFAADTVVAKIGDTEYTSFASAWAAAKDMTGNVTVDIYGEVEFTNGMELKGNFTSITFNGKDSAAKITIRQNAGGDYLEAHGKIVAFNNLTLAKANPAWSGNSGHMGNYFSIQGGIVTYTGCVFPNGACTSTGTATYTNCLFQNTSEYGLWVYDDALVTVNGGVIDSAKGIKVYSEVETSITSTLTVQHATFTENVSKKPAVAVGYAESITLIGNTYNNPTGEIELDSGSDADCEGIDFVVQDANGNDITSTLTVINRVGGAPCGVFVNGKVFTSVTNANAEGAIKEGADVTVLYVPTSAESSMLEGTNVTKNYKNYVSLGDSMTNGYGLPGYEYEYPKGGDENDECAEGCTENHTHIVFHWANGYLQETPASYPVLFAKENNFILTQMAMSAMRVEDLHWVLEADPDNLPAFVTGEWDDAWYTTYGAGDYYTWDEFTTGRFEEVYPGSTTANVIKEYQEAVKEADVISLGIGNANFGVFMLGRLTDAIGFGGKPEDTEIYTNLDNALRECAPNVKSEIEVLLSVTDAKLSELLVSKGIDANSEMFSAIIDTFKYAVLSYALNYAGTLEAILTLNPDAEIILVGIMNTMAGMQLDLGNGQILEMADVLGILVNPVNAYIAALPTYMQATGNATYANATFYYAEAPEVQCMVENYKTELENGNDIVRDRFVTEIVGTAGDPGMVWEKVVSAFSRYGINLQYITLEDVKAYEEALKANNPVTDVLTPDQITSCAVYLAFENAIVESSANTTVSLNSILALATGLDSIFNGVAGQLQGENLNDPVVVTNVLTAALTSDPTHTGLFHLFARMMIGNGLGAHPSATGHNQLAKAVINAYENGYTAEDQTKENLKVAIPAAYAEAYKYALKNGYIDMAKGYIGIASGALGTANTYVSTLEVPAQLLNTKALLLEEIGKTQVTLEKINALLNIDALTPETWAQILAMEEEIYAHMATLEDLAAELGVVGNIAMDQIGVVANYYAGVIDAIANNAYAWVANGVTEFNAEYAALVEAAGLAADKVDPELGAAVRAYLIETPAEALAIMYAAGDDAIVELIAAAAAASDDIKVIVTAISAILDSDITAIANAVKNSNEVAAIMAQIDAVKNQIAAKVDEMMNYPVSSALAYQKIINQLKGQLAILQGQLVDAILNSVDDVDPTLRPLLNKALNALKDAVRVAANYGAEYGAWFDARFDEMLGDLLALLIDNTNEFGSIAGPILGETIDNFLHYVGNMAYQKGTEFLDKVENEIIPEFIDTLKGYGAQAWAQLVAKLDALGLLDAVDQAQKDLNYLYELINSYITDDLAGAYATLLDRMTELKDNIADLIETVGNELANTSDEAIRATLAALQEKLETLYNAILALENVVNEAIRGNINTAIAMAQVALNNVAAAVADLAGVLSEDAAAAVADLANDVKVMLNEAYVDAITDTYTVAPDSYYVAMGDSSVFGENTYAQKLAAELGLTTSQFINLSAAGMSVAETIGLVNANASEIAKADLITIGYSNNTMMEFVITQLKAATGNGAAQPMDWTALVGEKLVPHVQKALADITADMLASGVDAQYAELLSVAVEAYAYAAVSHALNYPTVVGSIHEINPDALVVIVGMYNPLAGVSVKLSSTETIEIGDYVQKLIDLANMETLAYAMLAPNTIYVDAPNVTTQAQPGEIPVVNFLMGLLMNGTDKYYATEDGHAYIAQQILNALTVTKSGLLGDANNDGVVDSYDATLILQYLADYIGKEDINYAVCDVDGDGFVDSYDVTLILQYLAEYITSFPAEIQ